MLGSSGYRNVSPVVSESYAVIYRLIEVHVTVADFDVEPAFRIGADPRFEVHGRALATKIRKGHQVAQTALFTLRKYDRLHYLASQPKSVDHIAYIGACVKCHDPAFPAGFIHKNMHRRAGRPNPGRAGAAGPDFGYT